MKRRRGSTLLELLIVMSVWSFIMVAVLGFYIYGTRVNKKHGQMSEEIRAVQQIADKLNSYLRNAYVIDVRQFPGRIAFDRVEDGMPVMPGVLLPNWQQNSEWLRFGPDPARTSADADVNTCLVNALFIGGGDAGSANSNGTGEDVVMQLPAGLIPDFLLKNGLLFLELNETSRVQRALAGLPRNGEEARQLLRWQAMNHYLQYRGMGAGTGFTPNP